MGGAYLDTKKEVETPMSVPKQRDVQLSSGEDHLQPTCRLRFFALQPWRRSITETAAGYDTA
ncbi:MAG: hypothetical protein AAF742_07640 [Pseudomonadota bacterium]